MKQLFRKKSALSESESNTKKKKWRLFGKNEQETTIEERTAPLLKKGKKALLESIPETIDLLAKEPEYSAFSDRESVHIFSAHTFIAILARKWKSFVCIILCISVLMSSIFFLKSAFSASAVMSLNFEESSKGKNPNGTRFNISEFRSYEVVEGALEEAGLTGKVDPQVILNAISITTVASRSFIKADDYYITSSYKITFDKPLTGLTGISASDMLSLICKTYKDNFYAKHIISASVLFNEEDAKSDYDDLDYSEISAYLNVKTNTIERYVDMRVNEAGSFVTENGETFKSLKKLIGNLRQYDLANYDSFIWENGIAKNKQQQIETLKYINHNLEWTYKENMAERDTRVAVLNEYNQAMTASILIPTYDEQQEFYMARTKTGIDDLANIASVKLTKAEQAALQISQNEDRITKLQNSKETKQSLTSAEKMVEAIHEKLSQISEKIVEADNLYTLQKTRNYITFAKSGFSIIGSIHLKRVLIIDAFVFVILYLFFAFQKKKKFAVVAKANYLKNLEAKK